MSDGTLPANDRDLQSGRFAKGNPGGSRRRSKRDSAAFRRALQRHVGPADFRKIVGALVKAAAEGDVAAARLLLGNLLSARSEQHALDERLAQLESALQGDDE